MPFLHSLSVEGEKANILTADSTSVRSSGKGTECKQSRDPVPVDLTERFITMYPNVLSIPCCYTRLYYGIPQLELPSGGAKQNILSRLFESQSP